MILEELTFKQFGYLTSSLTTYSSKKVFIKCDYCGRNTQREYVDILKARKYTDKDSCCKKGCTIRKKEDSFLKIYGVTNISKIPETRKNRKLVQIGQKFSYWTVIAEPIFKKYGIKNPQNAQFATCQCVCGTIREVIVRSLGNKSKSCGCKMIYLLSLSRKSHGDHKNALYKAWTGMKSRCFNKNGNRYARYGGRGIKVCDEWLNNYLNFKNWSMSHGYQLGLSLDRVEVDGNYEPSNCEWVTVSENSRRQTSKREEKIRQLESENTILKEGLQTLRKMYQEK